MKADILCTLLAQRISPEQFQVRGDKVVFFDPDKNNKPCTASNESPYDTPENRAIVEDVIKNYASLKAAHLAKQQAIADAKLAKTQEIIDSLPAWNTVSAAVDNIANLADAKVFIKKLARVVYILARTEEKQE